MGEEEMLTVFVFNRDGSIDYKISPADIDESRIDGLLYIQGTRYSKEWVHHVQEIPKEERMWWERLLEMGKKSEWDDICWVDKGKVTLYIHASHIRMYEND